LRLQKAQTRKGYLPLDLPKPYIFNPWFGAFALSVGYDGNIYDQFITESSLISKISIEAEKYASPPDSFVFDKFMFDLVQTIPVEPEESEFWNSNDLWISSNLWL
jgi:hypothetical protein